MLSLDTLKTHSFLDHERDRLQAHFEWVIAVLRAQRTTGLAPDALAARERMIAALEYYRDRGVFPRNPLTDRMVPTFVDHGGRECAVAHLMQATGDDDFVARIHDRLNLEHVAAMAGPELDAWAERAGLSVYEVAFIQPKYCSQPDTACRQWVAENCNGSGPPSGCPCHEIVEPDGTSCPVSQDYCALGACQNGECVDTGGVRDCSDDDPSTFDTCHPTEGCLSTAMALPGGDPADGGDEDGCSQSGVPSESLAPVLAALFLMSIARRARSHVFRQ